MSISLIYVDELIEAREKLHGGGAGAPQRLVDGQYEGSALNRACVVMLSSALQAFVSDVFIACSQKAFGRELKAREEKAYNATWDRWGNPSDKNIVALFQRLGVIDVLDGLSWQRQPTDTLKKSQSNQSGQKPDRA